MEHVTERVKSVRVETKEAWIADEQAITLPVQFVRAARQEMKTPVKGAQVGLISLSPLYNRNFPKTEAEVKALERLTARSSRC
ncbi:MAG TPA: hypothetical protein VFS39_07670 [Nitrospira sp.]|nr:hypothetical protein [Nitrospira sp.]